MRFLMVLFVSIKYRFDFNRMSLNSASFEGEIKVTTMELNNNHC